MFEFPKVTHITLSSKDGRVLTISDMKTIKKIQQLCIKGNAFVALNEPIKESNCDIWVDFNNKRAVIGICSNESTYGNLSNEKSEIVDTVIDKEVYYYILELLQISN